MMNAWKQEEIEKLKEMRGSGHTHQSIASVLGRPFNAVKKKWSNMTKMSNPTITTVKPYNNLYKVFGLFDFHYPENIPHKPLLAFLKQSFKPDRVVLGGDMWDLRFISHWNEICFSIQGFSSIREQLLREASYLKAILEQFKEACPNARFDYILGNHEDWLRQLGNKFPQFTKEKLTLEDLLGLGGLGINLVQSKWDSVGGLVTIGKLTYFHGDQFSGENTPKQVIQRTRRNAIFGHFHTYKAWSGYDLVDSVDKQVAVSVPGWCHLAPAYSARPNDWMCGFHLACVKEKSGNFSQFTMLANPKNGGFIDASGKEWE